MPKPASTRLQDWAIRLRGCAAAVVTGLAATLLLLAALPVGAAIATTFFVNPGDSIQAAINGAAIGDTISINPGTYTESLTLSKAVNLTGVNSATVIIHAASNQRVLTISGTIVTNGTNVSGLTLTGGLVTGTSTCPESCGGGVAVLSGATPHLHDLILKNNTAGNWGGGLYVASSALAVDNAQILNNTAGSAGGGAMGGFLAGQLRGRRH